MRDEVEVAPVTYPFVIRKIAAWAMSSGVPMRPTGTRSAHARAAGSQPSPQTLRTNAVSQSPGDRELTRMGPSSLAIERVKASTAPALATTTLPPRCETSDRSRLGITRIYREYGSERGTRTLDPRIVIPEAYAEASARSERALDRPLIFSLDNPFAKATFRISTAFAKRGSFFAAS